LNLSGTRGAASFGGHKIKWRIETVGSGRNLRHRDGPRAGREFFDADKVGSTIALRHWRPGDRFQPIGMKTSVKLQDLFGNQKIPRARRHELAVATAASGELFWVEGLRISERFKLDKATVRCLSWGWQPSKGRVLRA
jgi:tRNA(Ile)-lysidine synthase